MPYPCSRAEPATVGRRLHILLPMHPCQQSEIQFVPVFRVQISSLSEARPWAGTACRRMFFRVIARFHPREVSATIQNSRRALKMRGLFWTLCCFAGFCVFGTVVLPRLCEVFWPK